MAPLQSQSSDDRKDADRSPEDADFKGGKELYQSGGPEQEEDDRSLSEVPQGSHNIVYEAKDDTTGVSFEKNGVKEWAPIVVTNYGKELGVKEENCVTFRTKMALSSPQGKENVSSPHQLLDELVHG